MHTKSFNVDKASLSTEVTDVLTLKNASYLILISLEAR
jgi:hypothetical protein